ncbi:hypothetical protein Nmel_017000 [Mimus melanotis]
MHCNESSELIFWYSRENFSSGCPKEAEEEEVVPLASITWKVNAWREDSELLSSLLWTTSPWMRMSPPVGKNHLDCCFPKDELWLSRGREALQQGQPCPCRYLRLELLLLPGGEGGAAVRRHLHPRHDSLDLAPHAVTLLCAEKLLQDKEAILVELEETG